TPCCMSTVTLSKPHCAITSAEKPDGIASQAFTTALPEAHTFLTLLATLVSFPVVLIGRHCLEPQGEARQSEFRSSGLLRCAARAARTKLGWRYSLLPPPCHEARGCRFGA